ncbi:hypothetical protein KHM83_19025 [Fusibacter paucivorans]|uniref:Uncharacterized protein n=1 Tax=Fusibacter paucivorans TaxID=76009 RepID=A0ABS5PUB7_9FIRM|nr:hypothetical protein [Fusibacter paucivorans]MBS7528763.1 hypothetical protein [Fusibacter paucivorans]
MKHKNLRVLIVSIITGILYNVVTHFLVRFLIRGTNEWTLEMGDTVFYIMLVYSICAILGSGLLCFKDMSKSEIAKSSAVMVLYYVIVLIFEKITFEVGLNGLFSIYTLLIMPINIYSTMTQITLRYFGNVWIGVALGLCLPFVYILFGKKQHSEDTMANDRIR